MDYIAYLHKERNSDFGVSFPDFPGCVTAGKTLDQARRMAAQALALHIDGMIEDAQLDMFAGWFIAQAPAMPAWNAGDEFEAARKHALAELGTHKD